MVRRIRGGGLGIAGVVEGVVVRGVVGIIDMAGVGTGSSERF